MTKTKTKVKKTEATPANQGQRLLRYEKRDYGTVKVKTPRQGVAIEQLMPEKADKKNRK